MAAPNLPVVPDVPLVGFAGSARPSNGAWRSPVPDASVTVCSGMATTERLPQSGFRCTINGLQPSLRRGARQCTAGSRRTSRVCSPDTFLSLNGEILPDAQTDCSDCEVGLVSIEGFRRPNVGLQYPWRSCAGRS